MSKVSIIGSGHAVHDISTARGWLEQELNELVDGQPEPMIDLISADGVCNHADTWNEKRWIIVHGMDIPGIHKRARNLR